MSKTWNELWLEALGSDCREIVDRSQPDKRSLDEVVKILTDRIKQAIEDPNYGAAEVGRCMIRNILERPLNRHDVIGQEKDALKRFYDRHIGEDLTSSDLRGVAAQLIFWCNREGLVCRISRLFNSKSPGYPWRFYFIDVYPKPLETAGQGDGGQAREPKDD
ncbi:MAG: hypothetical protein ABIJ46_02215 [bacterium]